VNAQSTPTPSKKRNELDRKNKTKQKKNSKFINTKNNIKGE
jgi:hypothetical protein